MSFKVEYLDEPYLMFSNGGKSKDPRIGLLKFGPRTPVNEPVNVIIKVGLIGCSNSVSEIQNLLKEMRNRILPNVDSPKKWRIPFPGLGKDSPLKISINLQKRWREIFSPDEINYVIDQKTKNDRIEVFIKYIEHKMKVIYEKESPPDVIIVCIPEEIYLKCVSPASIKEKMQTDYSDFHSRIKLHGIVKKIPTQIIHPYTLKGFMVQDRCDIAWNLTVGLLYKSQKGHPWKLAELEENTCFAGISFYKEREAEKNVTKASMAQVFLDTGESFILRVDPIDELQGEYQNHFSRIDAINVTKKIIKQYRDVRGGVNPERLVIHKSSNFWNEERDGMLNAAAGISKIDLITIRENHPIRLFSSCDYPVLRGTLLSAPDSSEYYLYTTGYIPTLGTYPGHRIPKPIVIKPDFRVRSTPIQDICKEILAFTKLDWNSSHFCKKIPVTIEISRSVGKILAESRAKDIDIDPHYYFYM